MTFDGLIFVNIQRLSYMLMIRFLDRFIHSVTFRVLQIRFLYSSILAMFVKIIDNFDFLDGWVLL